MRALARLKDLLMTLCGGCEVRWCRLCYSIAGQQNDNFGQLKHANTSNRKNKTDIVKDEWIDGWIYISRYNCS